MLYQYPDTKNVIQGSVSVEFTGPVWVLRLHDSFTGVDDTDITNHVISPTNVLNSTWLVGAGKIRNNRLVFDGT